LLAQDSVLFTQILDYILLAVIHPTGQRDHNEMEGGEASLHFLVIVSSQLKILTPATLIRVFGPYGIFLAGTVVCKCVQAGGSPPLRYEAYQFRFGHLTL
jgi:hypothetical protein